MKKVLVFWDIDGTLMQCGGDGTVALNRTFEKLYGVQDAFTKSGVGRTMDSVLIESHMKEYEIDKSQLTKIKTVFIDELERILDENKNKTILPGVPKLLKLISENGMINSLLTSNIRVGAETKLKSVGLGKEFIGGGFGDEYGEKWDIAKLAIREIEELTGEKFQSEQIVIIGDSVYDVQTAKNLGVNSIAVATGWVGKDILKAENPDLLLDDLSDSNMVMDYLLGTTGNHE